MVSNQSVSPQKVTRVIKHKKEDIGYHIDVKYTLSNKRWKDYTS